jgi:hypothetical protein
VTAQPVVMIMQTTIIVQPIQRVTQVQIVEIETVLEYPSSPTSAPERNTTASSPSYFHPSGTGVFWGTGTAAGTALSGMPIHTNGYTPWTFKRLV